MDPITWAARTDWDAPEELGRLLARGSGYVLLTVVGLFIAAVLVWLVWDLISAGLCRVGIALGIRALVVVAGETKLEDAEEADKVRRARCLTSLDRDPTLIGIRDVRRIVRLARRAEPSTYERCHDALERRLVVADTDDHRTTGRRLRGIASAREAWVEWRIERWLVAHSW